MWQSEVSIEIEAQPKVVYQRLKDFTGHSDFSAGLAKVEQLTPGSIGVGTRFRSEETVPGKYVSFSEITVWRAWVEHVMRTEWEFHLAPSGSGTRLTEISRWRATGPLGFLMLNLHRKRNVPRENRDTLRCIKTVLESEEVAA
jgi:hypothetical protein